MSYVPPFGYREVLNRNKQQERQRQGPFGGYSPVKRTQTAPTPSTYVLPLPSAPTHYAYYTPPPSPYKGRSSAVAFVPTPFAPFSSPARVTYPSSPSPYPRVVHRTPMWGYVALAVAAVALFLLFL